MSIEPGQTEGLKMIADWCKWAITVETAAIALIGSATFKNGDPVHMTSFVSICAALSIGAFVFSMGVALLVLSAIPSALQHIEPGMSVFDRKIYLFNHPIGTMDVYAYLLGGLFIIGILAFGAAIAGRLLG